MPRILIRVDIGGVHGFGHATRCKALAQVLVARGAEVGFMSETPALAAFVTPFPCAGARQPDYLELDVLVIDTKAVLDEAWYARFAGAMGCRIVRIDHVPTDPWGDLIILPNAHVPHVTTVRLEADFPGRILHGWDFVMLPEDVTDGAPLPYDEREQQIVFCAGGSDPDGVLQQMYDWTADLEIDAQSCFLIGAKAEYDRLVTYQLPRQSVSFVAPFTRAHLAEASLVVTTFGQTVYEALWYQTPMVCVARIAQEDGDGWNLVKNTCGAIQLWPSVFSVHTPDVFCEMLTMLWQDVDRRVRMHTASAGLIDGRGVDRIAEAILALV